MDVLERLIRKVFKLDSAIVISDKMGPGDIPGWDSLGTILLLCEIERLTRSSIPIEDMATIESIEDLRNILKKNGIDLEM